MTPVTEALAIAFQRLEAGNLAEAEQVCWEILQASPENAGAVHVLALVARQAGRHDLAEQYARRALEIDPDEATFHNTLGEACRALGSVSEAAACYLRAIELRPGYAEAFNNLGVASAGQGRLDYAAACFRQALVLKPDYAEACNNLGIVLSAGGDHDNAAASLEYALLLRPDYVEAHSNLGSVRREQGRLEEAAACYRRALELQPGHAAAHHNLGNILKDQGRPEEAIACYQRALDLQPGSAALHSALLATLHYCVGVTLAELGAAHAEFDRRHAAPLRVTWPAHDRPPREVQRSLRLGFVSGEFCRHPVADFSIRLLENLDRRQCEALCYSDRLVPDSMTARFMAAAAGWCNTYGMTDKELANRIDEDRIDVLFDLAGHFGKNRILVFARKPAPIQITWLGYEGTTGLKAIDYLLADKYLVPPEAERYYAERVLRMPDSFACFDPPDDAPPVGALPALTSGRVTFGSFNNPVKLNARVIQCWARILHQVPRSRLVLKYRGLDDKNSQDHFRKLFVNEGVTAGQVTFSGASPRHEAIALYSQVDVALDTFPFTGGATTCDALWMGVPVVTCPGDTFASRHGLSHLSNIGLADLIAFNLDQYVETAVALARDLPRLAAIRAGLRDRVSRSPLCDGKRFAENLTEILRQLWLRETHE